MIIGTKMPDPLSETGPANGENWKSAVFLE